MKVALVLVASAAVIVAALLISMSSNHGCMPWQQAVRHTSEPSVWNGNSSSTRYVCR